MSSFQLSAEKVNVNIEDGTFIATGVDLGDLVAEIGKEQLLDEMDLSDIIDYTHNKLKEHDDE